VLRAVLFDWGHTLMDWQWDDATPDSAFATALEAIGRATPSVRDVNAYFAERPAILETATLDEVVYTAVVQELFSHFGEPLDDSDLEKFLEAQHDEWVAASLRLGATTHALLESLRQRGLRLGIVSNAFDPPQLLHRDLERTGVAERIDFAVFSSELGIRKPHPAIFEHALKALEVDAGDALHVGDRLYEDVRGASEAGMKTVQAVWFRADENPEGAEPDYQAFTQFDVLNIVDRLLS
jgi:putative hydrolase of the HAD superfamily